MKRLLLLLLVLLTAGLVPAHAEPTVIRERCRLQTIVDHSLGGSSVQRYFDPILFPGQIGYPFEAPWNGGLHGPTHWHNFFGAVGLNEDSLADQGSMLAGATTCDDDRDRSAFWTPALVVTLDGEEYRVLPRSVVVELRGGVRWPPVGLAMISRRAFFDCGPGTTRTDVPRVCTSGTIQGVVVFPKWWNGTDLHSPGEAHVSFVRTVLHRVRLPRLSLRFDFAIGATYIGQAIEVLSVGGVPLCSSASITDPTCETGDSSTGDNLRDDPHSMHADVLFAWEGDPR